MPLAGKSFSAGTQYRYGFNGKENDRDINNGAQDYGMRISDKRLGRFLSVDPLTGKFAMLTPYQFASNTPIQAIDLDGAEAKIAIYGTPDNLKVAQYTQSDVNSFSARGDGLIKKGYTSKYAARNGKAIAQILVNETQTYGSISRVAIFAHGTKNVVSLTDNSSLYDGTGIKADGMRKLGGSDASDVSEIASGIYGIIKFEPDAVILFASCNAGGFKNSTISEGIPNIAENTAKEFNVVTIGATGNVSPVYSNGRETGMLETYWDDKEHPTFDQKPQFYLFVPRQVKTKQDVVITAQHSFLFFHWETKENKTVETTQTVVDREPLGNKIDPLKISAKAPIKTH